MYSIDHPTPESQPTPTAPHLVHDRDYTIALGWAVLHQNNPELPAKHSLTDEHIADLASSGIAVAEAAHAGIFSADADLALRLTGWAKPGLIFTYFDGQGRLYKWTDSAGNRRGFFRLKPDVDKEKAAKAKAKGEKVIKYLSPDGAPCFVYVPRVMDFDWCGGDGSFRGNRHIVITEGEKKALCACLHGIPALGLGGVDSWKTGIKDKDGNREIGFFVDEFNILSQRAVILLFDSDLAIKPDVADSISRMAYGLVEAYRSKEEAAGHKFLTSTLRLGKILKYSLLPLVTGYGDKRGGIGIDDAIVQWGADSVQELIDAALNLVELKPNKNEPLRLHTTMLFAAEPLSDDAPAKTQIVGQTHLRSLLGTLSVKGRQMTVHGVGYFGYDPKIGLWRSLNKDFWQTVPERIAKSQKWKNRKSTHQAQMLSMLCSDLGCNFADLNPAGYLAFNNGVLNLETRELVPHSHKFKMTRKLGFDYRMHSGCDNFLAWLLWLFAHKNFDGSYDENAPETEQMVRLVQALFKFTLTPKEAGPFPVEPFVYLLGDSGTGKSTLLEILQALAGEASTTWDNGVLSDECGRYQLLGKLLAVNTDLTGALSVNAIEALKKGISNEALRIKQLWKDGSSERLGCVYWAAGTKEIPLGQQGKTGINRRMVKIITKRPIEERDPFFKEKLLKELPGIWLWAEEITFDQAVRTIAEFMVSDRSVEEMTETLKDNNTVYDWITSTTGNPETQCLNGATVGIQEHFDTYRRFCQSGNVHALRRKNMKEELEHAGSIITTDKSTRVTKITIPPPEEVNRKRMLAL
jgi:phage/plasmid-associated DNA primase